MEPLRLGEHGYGPWQIATLKQRVYSSTYPNGDCFPS
jgi:hypothetical protein